jgi:hypothetical protein
MRLHLSRFLVALPLLLAACADGARNPVAPLAYAGDERLAAREGPVLPSGELLACPSDADVTGSAVIGREGGSLSVGGHELVVPAGAVPKATLFTIEAPASDVLEVVITADKRKDYRFKSPVTVRVSYARCDDAVLPEGSLIAWWIDPATRSKLGEMPGIDDRASRSLTFATDHLSGYAIAYRGGRNEDEQ